jgi:sugar lactone lactonase YvrE
MSVEIRCLVDANNALGEAPLWDPVDEVIYWVDILAPAIWRCGADGGNVKRWDLPEHIGALALRAQGGAVVALRSGFHFFDFQIGTCTPILDPEAANARTRFNDGKADRRGRFLAGTMDYDEADGIGGLYRLGPDLNCTKLEDRIVVSNGPCWSPDDETFYFADSFKGTIYAYDYDIETGTPSNKREFAPRGMGRGLPDGCTVDREGYLWNARWDGRCLIRFAPDGRVDRVIEVPMQRPTSCTFGGPDLDVLYVTSAPASAAVGETEGPEAGGLVAVRGLGVVGVPEPRFAG